MIIASQKQVPDFAAKLTDSKSQPTQRAQWAFPYPVKDANLDALPSDYTMERGPLMSSASSVSSTVGFDPQEDSNDTLQGIPIPNKGNVGYWPQSTPSLPVMGLHQSLTPPPVNSQQNPHPQGQGQGHTHADTQGQNQNHTHTQTQGQGQGQNTSHKTQGGSQPARGSRGSQGSRGSIGVPLTSTVNLNQYQGIWGVGQSLYTPGGNHPFYSAGNSSANSAASLGSTNLKHNSQPSQSIYPGTVWGGEGFGSIPGHLQPSSAGVGVGVGVMQPAGTSPPGITPPGMASQVPQVPQVPQGIPQGIPQVPQGMPQGIHPHGIPHGMPQMSQGISQSPLRPVHHNMPMPMYPMNLSGSPHSSPSPVGGYPVGHPLHVPQYQMHRASLSQDSVNSMRMSKKNGRPSTNTELYKTELCASYMSTGGNCPYGEKCQFAHGKEELKTVERPPKWRSKPCQNWVRTGTCSYNERCCFRHDIPPTGESAHD